MKRVGVFADLHCGSVVGLTPADYHTRKPRKDVAKRRKSVTIQEVTWGWFDSAIKRVGNLDVAIWNGDLIDGTGARSGGTEQITTDRQIQCEMASEVITSVNATQNILTYGTAYHASDDGEDWENVIARDVGARKIGAHEWVQVDGVVFDIKHHLGSSSVPHGRHTALAREHEWNLQWAHEHMQPEANVIIRSHVHYHRFSGGPGWLAMSTPALQGLGTKYGARRCSGTIDFGFLVFEVDGSRYNWWAELARFDEQKAEVIKI